jgi:hypothetical protein
VRKLFVNCCRVVPQACLDLIGYALQSLPQPLSSGERNSCYFVNDLLNT